MKSKILKKIGLTNESVQTFFAMYIILDRNFRVFFNDLYTTSSKHLRYISNYKRPCHFNCDVYLCKYFVELSQFHRIVASLKYISRNIYVTRICLKRNISIDLYLQVGCFKKE